MSFSLKDLEKIIADRANSHDPSSWTAKIVSQGINKASEKLGEEATETIIAAVTNNGEQLRKEAADLIYHLLVVLHINNVSLDEVLAELEKRTGQSGIAEKASRAKPAN